MGRTNKIKRMIHNAGYDESIYKLHKYEIEQQNRRMVQTTSFIGSIIMILLCITAFFVPTVSKVLPLYLTIAVLFLLIYLSIRGDKERSGMVVLICNYTFLMVAFSFALGLDVIQGNPTATTVCVLLVALPLLIVDYPWRAGIFFIFVSVCFMLESVFIKQSPKASIDVLNAFSFLIVGLFLGYKYNQMMLRNIVGQDLLAKERDKDTLTGLYNKGALEKRAIKTLEKKDAKASMIVIDMDNFKFVNDTYGHHTGDELLIKIGQVLQGLFRDNDFIGRFGGDEFVVFLPGNDNHEMVEDRAKKILEGVSNIRLDINPRYRAHVCMGIASYPRDGSNYEELFQHSDAAMYDVKKNGKNGFGFYNVVSKKQILIVDDIELNRNVLRKTLQDEYDILEAENGHVAMDILKQEENIVMVITDIQMPKMDGIELIRQIRDNHDWNEIAVIANTQYGDLKQEENLFQLGVDDFVYKAASPKIIQMRVKNVMRVKQQINQI